MWLGRAEYDFPIYEQVFRGVVFVDAGNVTYTWNENLLKTYRVAWGFGVRIRITPIFGPVPLALDFAWPLKSEKGDRTQVVSFSIGRPFF